MNRKFIGVYLIAVLAMLCTYVPFDLMSSNLNRSSGIEHLSFERFWGYAPVWYNYIEGSSLRTAIDYKKLIIQLVIITIVFAIIYMFIPTKFIKKDKKINLQN